MAFFLQNLHWVWFALCIIFALVEAFTMGLTTIWFSAASFLMIFVSLFKIPLSFQIFIFCAISLLLLFFTRPFFKKKFFAEKLKTNVESLIGKTAIVTQEITKFNKGEVKIAGVLWTAADIKKGDIPKDAEVIVKKIEGATAIVEMLEK